MEDFILKPGTLTYTDLKQLTNETNRIQLDPAAHAAIIASEKCVADTIKSGNIVYGINTGFGALANTRIKNEELKELQTRLVLSHAAGVGDYLPDALVRLILILKINSLARGYSGVRLETINALIQLLNARIYPCIPSKGSVGASGDLAPLAHLSAVLLGVGEARHENKILSATDALAKINLKPLTLAPKEGLALLNGTQVSTALAIHALMQCETLFNTALIAGALSVDATKSSSQPFDARISDVRGFKAQSKVAACLQQLLAESGIMASHVDCEKVQDAYSLRCQPQVMGACLTQSWYCLSVLMTEVNAVSDNPLIFTKDNSIISGGNFHAEPVAFAADALALCIAEIASLSERRIALLMDNKFSGLPAFLVNNPGLNSGFMIAHVTASALVAENKCLATPASIDSLPTSANQEDHVSMATYAARRLLPMLDNAFHVIAIELLAACQGIDFLRPLQTSSILETVCKQIRQEVPFYDQDRFFAPDIKKINLLLHTNKFDQIIKQSLFND